MRYKNIKLAAISTLLTISLTLVGCAWTIPIPQPPFQTPTNNPPPSTTANQPDWQLPPRVNQPSLPDFTSVVARVKPSVAAINTEVTSQNIFNQPITQRGAGSGWILDPAGYIVTNYHVIDGANTITATLSDGRTLPAQVVGTDATEDLAIIKVDAAGLPALTMGDSAGLELGEWVLAIGNALGMGISVKQGIISRLNVSLDMDSTQTLYNLIETSAAINPGNSGGPLVDMAGQVIGITSAKIASSGVEGMGYAISSEEAAPIIRQLITTGYATRPFLGVSLYTVDQLAISEYNLAVSKGALIVKVGADSPADRAGLREGDVITRFNGKDVDSIEQLIPLIRGAEVGKPIEFTYWRGNQQINATVTLVMSAPPG